MKRTRPRSAGRGPEVVLDAPFCRRLRAVLGAALVVCAGTCDQASDSAVDSTPWQALPHSSRDNLPASTEVLSPKAYVTKVKNLLTGLPPTDAEVSAVAKDANALRGLIDQWMTLPEHRAKMLDFFRNAFQ